MVFTDLIYYPPTNYLLNIAQRTKTNKPDHQISCIHSIQIASSLVVLAMYGTDKPRKSSSKNRNNINRPRFGADHK